LPVHGSADPAIGKAWVIWHPNNQSASRGIAYGRAFRIATQEGSTPQLWITAGGDSRRTAHRRDLLLRGMPARTGSAFGISTYWMRANVELSGLATPYVREGQEGRQVTYYFCPKCGSSVYWELDRRPSQIGISGGSFFDLNFPAPIRSVWERSKPNWISIPNTEHFDQNPPPPPRQS
jgi:hypothetical protein